MADCKACGEWFVSTSKDELCPACEKALKRLKGYAVPVRHGRWIEDGDVQICSECGEEHEWADYRAPYCDTCGAKMDGGQSRLVSVTTRQPDEWKSVLTCVTRKCVPLPEPPKEEAQ